MESSKIEKQLSSHSRLLMDIKAMLKAFTPQPEQELSKQKPTLKLKLKQAKKRNDVLSTLKKINLNNKK